MAFFDDKQLASKGIQPSEDDIAFALQLRNIASRAKLLRSNNPKKWASEFRLLRKFVQGDANRIQHVLNELSATNCKGFRICSAFWLRKNFLWIESKLGLLEPPKLAVTPLASNVLQDIVYKSWEHYGVDTVLLEYCVIESCNNYEEFLARVNTRRKGSPSAAGAPVNDRPAGFAQYIWADLHHARSVMTKWFEGVRQALTFWADWNGSLVPFKFFVGHKRITTLGRAYAEAYCGDANYWHTFVRALGYED